MKLDVDGRLFQLKPFIFCFVMNTLILRIPSPKFRFKLYHAIIIECNVNLMKDWNVTFKWTLQHHQTCCNAVSGLVWRRCKCVNCIHLIISIMPVFSRGHNKSLFIVAICFRQFQVMAIHLPQIWFPNKILTFKSIYFIRCILMH